MTELLQPQTQPLITADGHTLAAHYWPASGNADAVVVINPATAVKAAYYHRYARFLAASGMAVLTYDYRGIGDSHPGNLRALRQAGKVDWGRWDCAAALDWAHARHPELPLRVVAHSIGGLSLGLAANNHLVDRALSVGAQFAYWPDYAPRQRKAMWLRWHLLMPVLTALLGYFPARRLGWHEDLPAAAAYEWAFRPATLEQAYRRHQPDPLLACRHLRAELLALRLTDDPFGTEAAIDRLLDYFPHSPRWHAALNPASVGEKAIGHFAFFHDRFQPTLWQDTVAWLRHGELPARAEGVKRIEAIAAPYAPDGIR